MFKLFFLLSPFILFAQNAQIIYFTDAHQLYELDDIEDGRGGVARLKTVVDNAKKENNETLAIHGGDFVGGILYGGMYKGNHMPNAFNQIPIDIFNFGQHEFDYGVDHLITLINQTKGTFFTSNLVDDKGNSFHQLPTYLIKKINNQTILFIGLTDQMQTTKKDSRAQQADLFLSVEKVFKQVKNQLFNQIVVVSQMDLAKNRELVKRFPTINLVLTEEVDEYNSQINYVGKTPIIATAGNMSSVAKINLSSHNLPQIEIIPLDKNTLKDKVLAKLEAQEKNNVEKELNQKLAVLEVDLDAFQSLKTESLAGNFVTDAMRDYYKTDLALIDGSGIRKNVEKGDFTYKSARTLLPFGNKMVVVELNGKDFKAFLEQNILSEKPKLIQVAGTKFIINKKSNSIEFPHLENEKKYTLVLNDYNFGKLKNYTRILIGAEDEKSIEDYEVLKIYVEKQQIINPKIENRITIIDYE
ncbi:bifunctional UDP-sugar hydrolase/5'-nucleotidase [Algoriella sp.]|uniref:bifunctional metallophosphatase/5'-nucleotidase n=1 Tax=Algoriella sp. TaxID=1872434 RepID=UPI001B157682|nr:5'-nucleotidase C-terminal domain-containing protein [Algoriella sp.]MBO6212886.1 bifunctional metallophosphatase/5'-nucleotidase [Algoriella sp.]